MSDEKNEGQSVAEAYRNAAGLPDAPTHIDGDIPDDTPEPLSHVDARLAQDEAAAESEPEPETEVDETTAAESVDPTQNPADEDFGRQLPDAPEADAPVVEN